ncbi:MAG: hypothetical protein ABIH23_18805 [bacterium]
MDTDEITVHLPESLGNCHLEKRGKIEFACNDQGLFIVGNAAGLRSLARVLLLLSRAEGPFSAEVPPSFHIPGRWDMEGKQKNVILNAQWLHRHLEDDARESFSFDVTLIRHDDPPYIQDFEEEDRESEP